VCPPDDSEAALSPAATAGETVLVLADSCHDEATHSPVDGEDALGRCCGPWRHYGALRRRGRRRVVVFLFFRDVWAIDVIVENVELYQTFFKI
jgi:hypothetical protein